MPAFRSMLNVAVGAFATLATAAFFATFLGLNPGMGSTPAAGDATGPGASFVLRVAAAPPVQVP